MLYIYTRMLTQCMQALVFSLGGLMLSRFFIPASSPNSVPDPCHVAVSSTHRGIAITDLTNCTLSIYNSEHEFAQNLGGKSSMFRGNIQTDCEVSFEGPKGVVICRNGEIVVGDGQGGLVVLKHAERDQGNVSSDYDVRKCE
jgi:hypothetical protein